MCSDRPEPSLDTVLDLLAHRRRRYAISRLYEHGTLTLADLADEVACLEHDERITEIPAEEVTRIYMSLWHTHIPKLADAGVVEYEQDQDMVSLTDAAASLRNVDPFEGIEPPEAAGEDERSTGS